MSAEKEILKLINPAIPQDSKEYKKIIKLLNQLADENYWRGHDVGYGQCSETHKECQGSFY